MFTPEASESMVMTSEIGASLMFRLMSGLAEAVSSANAPAHTRIMAAIDAARIPRV
jgi:hypothetical protein